MKFNCGPSKETKRNVIWPALYEQLKEEAKNVEWERWYAWHPVRLDDDDCRWFEYVERLPHHKISVEPANFGSDLDYSYLYNKPYIWRTEYTYRAIEDAKVCND